MTTHAPSFRSALSAFAPRIARALLLPTLLFLPACSDEDDDDTGHADGIGNYCEADDDCQTGECYIGPGGGYCTTACTDEGDETECPADTVCKPIQGGARRCLLICGSETACDGDEDCQDEHCPNGSSCVSVSNTDHLACEPEPG
jgi:hypothetical protein